MIAGITQKTIQTTCIKITINICVDARISHRNNI